MLNQLIAQYVVQALEPLNGSVFSRLAGLVKVLETDAFTPGKISKFPIPVDATEADCSVSRKTFPDLVPDEKERLIVYFEDGGSTNSNGRWTSRLRLVGWGNSDLFEIDSTLLTAVLITKIAKLLKRLPVIGGSPVDSLKCEVVGSPTADTNLFSKYSYSETRSQYLLAPYFAFGLDLQLTFVLNDDCASQLTGLTATGC